MKWFMREVWDFLFGALLIGGLPLSAFALLLLGSQLYESVFKARVSESAMDALFLVAFTLAVVGFGWALLFRFRRRLTPKWVLAMEAGVGIVGAGVVFMVMGVLTYAAYGN
jgi:hypothetical protein